MERMPRLQKNVDSDKRVDHARAHCDSIASTAVVTQQEEAEAHANSIGRDRTRRVEIAVTRMPIL